MTRSSPPPRDILVPIVAALIAAERRIAMLERRLGDAKWLGPGESPNEQDKRVAFERLKESLVALGVSMPQGEEEFDLF